MNNLNNRISDALEAELGTIYDESGINSGDITPEQLHKWGRLTMEMAELFAELINQNK